MPDGDVEASVSRSVPFSKWESGILAPYGDALSDLTGASDWVGRAASEEVALRAISVQASPSCSATIETALRFLLRAAGETYEGQPVHLNLLLDTTRVETDTTKPLLDDLQKHAWHALLGSGLSTGMVVDGGGRTSELLDLPSPTGASLNALRPEAFGSIGEWTDWAPTRVALSLTRSRELLVHQGGQLKLIYRAGRWRGMPFYAVRSARWSPGANLPQALKAGVLASVTDACLGHHGAAIGIVSKKDRAAFLESETILPADLWPANVRSQLFPKGTFHTLPRRLRLEMLSMDGATILDHTGKVLAAGAIVKVPSGSTGGGRLAAVKALSEFGAAIKVSQDGPATIFGPGGEIVAALA